MVVNKLRLLTLAAGGVHAHTLTVAHSVARHGRWYGKRIVTQLNIRHSSGRPCRPATSGGLSSGLCSREPWSVPRETPLVRAVHRGHQHHAALGDGAGGLHFPGAWLGGVHGTGACQHTYAYLQRCALTD